MAIDYKMMASQIISNIGGDNNIEYLTHCATRLRFNLKDLTKVNESALNDMPDIIKVINNNSQFQIVIGPRVEHVYRAIEQARVVEPASQTVAEPVEKTSLFNRLLSNISAIFTPYIGVLAGVGMLKGLVVLLQTMNLPMSLPCLMHWPAACSPSCRCLLRSPPPRSLKPINTLR
ncbi:hypothetical protein A8A01_14540 [Ewingella americana]|nr:hypothetical protein A8A01_14540 [Ewingella americana]